MIDHLLRWVSEEELEIVHRSCDCGYVVRLVGLSCDERWNGGLRSWIERPLTGDNIATQSQRIPSASDKNIIVDMGIRRRAKSCFIYKSASVSTRSEPVVGGDPSIPGLGHECLA